MVAATEAAKKVADAAPDVSPLKLILLLTFLTCSPWMALLKMAQRQLLMMITVGQVFNVCFISLDNHYIL